MLDRIFDCKNNIFNCIDDIVTQYKIHHHLHIINTGVRNKEVLLKLLPLIGFTKDNFFVDGGRASSKTQEKWIVKNVLRNMDYYPKEYYLLPNTEIQYSKSFPENVLMYVEKATENEGRIFLHKIVDIENCLKNVNVELHNKIKTVGLKIVNGFLDENDSHKNLNYMKSWQELTNKKDINDALNTLSNEYDNVYIKGTTIMCESFVKGFKTFDNKEYINVPRIAMTEPSVENGYREFLFGDNSKFTQEEINILLEIYHDTKIGSDMNDTDIYLFNNITIAHSREAYTNTDRKVLVSMSGNYVENKVESLPSIQYPTAHTDGDIRYSSPAVEHQINEKFSSLIYDLNFKEFTPKTISEVNKFYKRYGYLQIVNTPYTSSIPEPVLSAIGFAKDCQFKWGGKDSGRTIRQPKGDGFHSVDKYPSELMLLPHQEIFYQRILPKNMLFHYRKTLDIGGRTLIHSGARLLEMVKAEDINFYNKLKKYGQSIITGFLDENHPLKEENFVRSWQDRFGTSIVEEALINCKKQTTHFDKCWMEDGCMLMTEITIPLFKKYEDETFMMFPRISYNKPSIINGNRRFVIGNGEEFNDKELNILLKAFYYTREGMNQKSGDILLVDNIKYGHSREPYIEGGVRDVAVIMSEEFQVDNF